MKGLIVKDFLTVKNSLKSMFLLSIVFCFIAVVAENEFFISFSAIYFAMLSTTTMTWDERSKFNHFAGIMPIKKSDIVTSKYIEGIFLCIISVILGGITSFFMYDGAIQDITQSIINNVSISIVYQSLMLPIIFKFGVEKSMIVLMISYFSVFFITGVIMFVTSKSNVEMTISNFENLNQTTFLILNLLFLVVLYIVSMLISLRINKNKEW